MKKNIIIILLIILLIVNLVWIVHKEKSTTRSDIIKQEEVDNISENKESDYIIIDGKTHKALNDGGSYEFQYYEIDFKNNIIAKKEWNLNKDMSLSLFRTITTSYTGKLIESKIINQNQSDKVKKILEQIIENDIMPDYTHSYPNILSNINRDVAISEKELNEFLSIIKN